MTRRSAAPAVRHEQVFYERIRDDECVTDLTLEAIVMFEDDRLAGWRLRPSIGPGVGPHYVTDLATARRVAWAWHHAADALEAAGAPRRLILPDGFVPGQTSIYDHLEGART